MYLNIRSTTDEGKKSLYYSDKRHSFSKQLVCYYEKVIDNESISGGNSTMHIKYCYVMIC